jgi:hypothetical protein
MVLRASAAMQTQPPEAHEALQGEFISTASPHMEEIVDSANPRPRELSISHITMPSRACKSNSLRQIMKLNPLWIQIISICLNQAAITGPLGSIGSPQRSADRQSV